MGRFYIKSAHIHYITLYNSRMSLNLKKPLIVFDLETTGLDLVKDRIIQLSYIKVFPDGKEERTFILIPKERYLTKLRNLRV